ncbi:MAG: 3-deoxy-7-phosphoheptulonate synthase, partial [Oscillospiraceae bacterium]|nr:3-deoxy-7-phosphoheptulonate synthase [Oscillospiraceae bacterium]
MIIILKPGAQESDTHPLKEMLTAKGLILQEISGATTSMIGLAGDTSLVQEDAVMCYPFVERIMRVMEPYKLAGRKFHPEDSVFDISGRKIGGGEFAVIAGPCSVESEEQILSIARDVKAAGAAFLRGGAFKPRSSPYAFKGLGPDGLELLKIARQKTGLPIVTEIMSSEFLENFAEEVDIIQVGARNMQNFSLLQQVGELKKPVLLKRGLANTIDELLMAAEY